MALDRKIAYIDLSTGEVETAPIPVEMRKLYLGGRGLDMYLLYNHLKPGIDPLGPDNVLTVSAGLLVGTPASASARTHIGAKSPLTGFIGSSNMGGFFAPELRWAGFDHLVIKGKADGPVYLWIHDGEIEIRDGSELWGEDIPTTQELIKEELGDPEVKALCIGVAGENLVRFANVMTGIKNAAGRTGMGAVMGSKNLKAIAVRGTMDIKIRHPEQALEYNATLTEHIASTKFAQIMQKWGTMFIYGVTNTTGLVRVRNFQLNQQVGGDIECEHIEKYSLGTEGCYGCVIHCRHKYLIKDGPHAGTYGEGPEYTSQGAFGMEVGCNDFETILVGNSLVNKYGMDTLETGSLIGWAMELYEKGILTDADTGGLKLEWGNDEAVLEMVARIANRQGLGDVLAEGPLRAAAKIGQDSLKYCIHVKGMSNLHSDERPTPSLALGIATSSRGADHLRSRPAIDLYHLPKELLCKIYGGPKPYNGPLSSDYSVYEGKARMVQWQEMMYEAIDCVGVCKYHTIFLSPNLIAFEELSRLIYLNTGLEFTPEEIWDIADRAYTVERLFNIREGLTRADDWLVDRYFDEPTPIGLPIARGKSIDRERFSQMIGEYYELHGWDENGVPRPETLEALGLGDEPSRML
ncbi:MAG: aldehyde ferredoxin oxidoreductase [Chloroflexi bacterium]|nr:MAG: aldehyde ferredoxin oxidoreductase [Chloroflexota bacterium]RLC82030.1 MAG: aldehyde ferredoxin oxidoreductase [Chloroflexota bacterium]HEY72730.1 aldehyde ferredoxin oxidoreductase family protein [Thermoflexia bacterium]